MKKICFLIGNLNNSGGTERVTSLIANELFEKDYDVSIVSLVEGNDAFFELNSGVKTYSLYSEKISFKRNFVGTVYKIRTFVKDNCISTLIVVDSISCVFTVPALFGLNVKHICWEHFNFNVDLGVSFRRIGRKLAAKYCNTVVTLTERDKQYWLTGTRHHSQITVIANPCPFPVQKHSKEEDTNIVLAAGRLTYQKGFDLLLEAWVEVNKVMPDWSLKIIGEGEDKVNLIDFIDINELNTSVELVGSTDDISQFYKEADIFCLSSRFEGFGMVLIEALAFGLPIVSFDCEVGPAEILEDTGSILVPVRNVDLLAFSLINLMKDDQLRKVISSKSKQKAEIYQAENIISQWIGVLNI